MSKSVVLEVPAVEVKYDLIPIKEFFASGETRITGKRLAEKRPGLVSQTAERDSGLLQEQGLKKDVNWVLFVGKDKVWYVYRFEGGFYRVCVSLDYLFRDVFLVACPSK